VGSAFQGRSRASARLIVLLTSAPAGKPAAGSKA